MANNSLRSFASGMIIATSIFTAVYYFQPTKIESEIVERHTLTDAEVQHYLNDKGYVSIPQQQYDSLMKAQQPPENEMEIPSNEEVPEKSTETKEQNKTDEKSVIEEHDKVTNQNKSEAENNDSVEQEQKVKSFTLEIKRGMNSIQIANKLGDEGIVKNSKEFEQFLINKNWNRSIQIGTYNLTSDMSYEQIGRILINK